MSRATDIDSIARRRAVMAYDGELQDKGWMDAADINSIAECYGGTYSQAWNEVRVATKQHLRLLMIDEWQGR